MIINSKTVSLYWFKFFNKKTFPKVSIYLFKEN